MKNKNKNNSKNNERRGDTFVGYRPTVIKNRKDKANSRQALKKDAKKRINDDWER